jgi:hypothetical protein
VAAYINDRTYREWHEHDYERLPWDQVNNELSSEAMSLGLKIKFDNLSKNLKSLPFPVSGAPQRSSSWSSKKYLTTTMADVGAGKTANTHNHITSSAD